MRTSSVPTAATTGATMIASASIASCQIRRAPRLTRRRRGGPPPRRRRRVPVASDHRRPIAPALESASRQPRWPHRAQRAVGHDDDVADLAGPERPGHELASAEDGTGEPGAERHEEHVVGLARGAEAVLGEQAGADVVADRDGHVDVGGDGAAQVEVAPAEVGRPDPDAGRFVDEAGHGDADGEQVDCAGGAAVSSTTALAAISPSWSRPRRGGAHRLGEHLAVGRHQGRLDPGAADVDPDHCFAHHGAQSMSTRARLNSRPIRFGQSLPLRPVRGTQATLSWDGAQRHTATGMSYAAELAPSPTRSASVAGASSRRAPVRSWASLMRCW